MLEQLERTRELVENGDENGAPLVLLGDAALADLNGQPDAALSMLKTIDTSRIPRGLAILVIRHAASLEVLVGDPDSAVEQSLRLLEISDDATSRFMVRRNRFHAGDPEGFRDRRYPLDLPERDNSRDDLTDIAPKTAELLRTEAESASPYGAVANPAHRSAQMEPRRPSTGNVA